MYPDVVPAHAPNLTRAPYEDAVQKMLVRGAIFAALAVMGLMAWTRNINWDEFYFLSQVHQHLDGRLDRPLQTVFVHAFGWLDLIPGHEVDQIAVARLVMLGFFGGTCLALHKIASRLTDPQAADIAVLAFVTAGFAIPHGSSFRADPMAAALLMGAVALMMTTRMGPIQIIFVALLSALGLLMTVKAALFLPVYLGVLVWRWREPGIVLRCIGAGVLGFSIAATLFFLHASTLAVAETPVASERLGQAARVTLGGSGLLPRLPELILWLGFSAGAVLLAGAGMLRMHGRCRLIALILFAGPLLSIVVYRNAFPYFFPFAVPALMIAVAFGAQSLRGTLVWKLALVLMVASGTTQSLRALSETNIAQRDTVAEVHRLFPQAVPYIDQNGMISSFPRHGFFMSTWGIAQYRAVGKPVFADLIAEEQPPLLLANRNELHAAMRPDIAPENLLGLLADDASALRAAYVHHAGAIWLAGQEMTLTRGQATARMPFAGDYRVHTSGPITIEGRPVSDGEVLALDTAPLAIVGAAGTRLRLVWDTDVAGVVGNLPETGLYAGFWKL